MSIGNELSLTSSGLVIGVIETELLEVINDEVINGEGLQVKCSSVTS